jgi:hypothetical protein
MYVQKAGASSVCTGAALKSGEVQVGPDGTWQVLPLLLAYENEEKSSFVST